MKGRRPQTNNMASTVMHIDRTYLGPIITGAVGKDVAIVVEAASCDWLIKLLRGFQLCASILIPETEAAVGTDCGQCAVHWVESNGIDLGQKNTKTHTCSTKSCYLHFLVVHSMFNVQAKPFSSRLQKGHPQSHDDKF